MTEEKLRSVREQLAGVSANTMVEKENRIYGLYNVTKRLELYYNKTNLLDIQSRYREGTRVTLFVPEPDAEAVQPLAAVSSGVLSAGDVNV